MGLSSEWKLERGDLAPGDLPCASFDWDDFRIESITSTDHPLFEKIYAELWAEFGEKGEMESRDTLKARFERDPSRIEAGHALNYQMLAVLRRGEFVAARDFSTIVCHEKSPQVVVHLSHVLIHPIHRGQGLVGWLRALPIQRARQALELHKLARDFPVTLVAEMEPLDESSGENVTRLRSYEKAGFRAVDPAQIQYLQPDFRPFPVIDQKGGAKPLPLNLILRRVGLEAEPEMSGSELKRLVRALYTMYGASFREKDMASVWEQFKNTYPSENVNLRLVNPTGVR